MKFILKHTNDIHEQHYFVKQGGWYHEFHLIHKVTLDIETARRFDTMPEALQVLLEAKTVINNVEGTPNGWDVIPVEK